MPRPKSPDPRVYQLRVRLTREEAALLDLRRGTTSRSDFIRHLIRKDRS